MPTDTDVEAARELIQGLLLEAGRLMENESVNLALTLPTQAAAAIARVRQGRR